MDSMKATGIIRRVDDLGRVVIPREIRMRMGIKEGEPLELVVGNDCVAFKRVEEQTASDGLKDFINKHEDSLPEGAYTTLTNLWRELKRKEWEESNAEN